jgi:hypothetical protein
MARFTRGMQLQLCRHAEVAHYRAGEWLWQQDAQPTDKCLLLIEGLLTLWQQPGLLQRESLRRTGSTHTQVSSRSMRRRTHASAYGSGDAPLSPKLESSFHAAGAVRWAGDTHSRDVPAADHAAVVNAASDHERGLGRLASTCGTSADGTHAHSLRRRYQESQQRSLGRSVLRRTKVSFL